MALARRALILAFVAVCALLLAVGVVAPAEPGVDRGATDAGVALRATSGAAASAEELTPSATKRTSPLVLLATVDGSVRRGRQRVRPSGRHNGVRRRRGRRPAGPPGGRAGLRAGATGPGCTRRRPRRRLVQDPAAQLDERLVRMALELDVLVGSLRY
jgi:hypothetical protein